MPPRALSCALMMLVLALAVFCPAGPVLADKKTEAPLPEGPCREKTAVAQSTDKNKFVSVADSIKTPILAQPCYSAPPRIRASLLPTVTQDGPRLAPQIVRAPGKLGPEILPPVQVKNIRFDNRTRLNGLTPEDRSGQDESAALPPPPSSENTTPPPAREKPKLIHLE